MKCGFSGGMVVDFPNSTKAKKFFLCLFAGEPSVKSTENKKELRGRYRRRSIYNALIQETSEISSEPSINSNSIDGDSMVLDQKMGFDGGFNDDNLSTFSVGTRTSIAFTDASSQGGKLTKSERNAAERLRKKLRRKRAPVKSKQWLLQKKR